MATNTPSATTPGNHHWKKRCGMGETNLLLNTLTILKVYASGTKLDDELGTTKLFPANLWTALSLFVSDPRLSLVLYHSKQDTYYAAWSCTLTWWPHTALTDIPMSRLTSYHSHQNNAVLPGSPCLFPHQGEWQCLQTPAAYLYSIFRNRLWDSLLSDFLKTNKSFKIFWEHIKW